MNKEVFLITVFTDYEDYYGQTVAVFTDEQQAINECKRLNKEYSFNVNFETDNLGFNELQEEDGHYIYWDVRTYKTNKIYPVEIDEVEYK